MDPEDILVRKLETDAPQEDTEKDKFAAKNFKQKKLPWYVIKQDSQALQVFNVVVSLFMLPVVCLNLYLIVFGDDGNAFIRASAVCIEFIFIAEFLLNFVTSYKDRETFDEIYEPRKIALNFVRYGSFFSLLLPLLPATFIVNQVFNITDPQVHQDLLCIKLVRLTRLGLGGFIPEASLLQVA